VKQTFEKDKEKIRRRNIKHKKCSKSPIDIEAVRKTKKK
jgi:hypothetical protein